ncbi:hypothetical protein CDD81_3663 [Ophiocordyceps australis]|uniref:Uncharacterized protein n=1 Tax=Ophiocordyceps australis TaxID=1399860 RepID=A0A2C5XRV1_9HYPO|nr:hypothetical protein CDD81_3663 [Ophiocordyceps australis]
MPHIQSPYSNVSPDQDLAPEKEVVSATQSSAMVPPRTPDAVNEGRGSTVAMVAPDLSLQPPFEPSPTTPAPSTVFAEAMNDASEALLKPGVASDAASRATAALEAASEAASDASSDSPSLSDVADTVATSPGKRSQYTMTARAVALALWSNNIKLKEISKQTGMKRDAFYKLLQRAKQRGFSQGARILPEHIEDGPRSGRPPNTSPTKLQSKKARSRASLHKQKETDGAKKPEDSSILHTSEPPPIASQAGGWITQ